MHPPVPAMSAASTSIRSDCTALRPTVNGYRPAVVMYSSGGDSGDDEANDEGESNNNTADNDTSSSTTKLTGIDAMLSNLTSAFPLFVLGSAILALQSPSTLTWVNKGNLIPFMLSAVMMGSGMTLERKDFAKVLTDDPVSVPLGVFCQVSLARGYCQY